MGSTREIRRRVKAVKNIRQITRAMELVAAAKMQRAVSAVQQSRRYAELAWDMLTAVTVKLHEQHHPLLAARPLKRLLVVLITSNRGLAGGFNSKVEDAARQYMLERQRETPGLVVDTVSVGRKGREYMQKFGMNIVADFTMSERASSSEEVLPLATLLLQDYQTERYDAVSVVYTDFVSMLRQEPKVRELLPVVKPNGNNLGHASFEDEQVEELEEGARKKHHHVSILDSQYFFEPTPEQVLENLVPRLLEMQLYQAVVESRASEQAARMMAMRNATDAAGDLINDLTLTYNQLRQSGITQELAEISAGRLALGV